MGLEMLTGSGIKPFTGNESDAHLFFINVDARLIAAGIDTASINQPPSSSTSTSATPSSSSVAPTASSSTGRATTRAKQRARDRRKKTATAAATVDEDDDDDDDDEHQGVNDDATAQTSTASSSTSTSSAGHHHHLLNPHKPQVDAAIFAFLLSILGGHPLQMAISDNDARSGCLALRRLKERYIRSGMDHIRRLKKELTTISWRADDSVDSFMGRLSDLNTQLLAAGMVTPADDLRALVRNALPPDFDLAMRFLEREEPPPSISRLTAELLDEERRLGRKKRASALAAVDQPTPSPFASAQGKPSCCPPRNKLTCAFCDLPRHCAQECNRLQAAKRHGLIDKLRTEMRNHGKRNGRQRGSFNANNTKKRASLHQGHTSGPRTATFAVDHHEALCRDVVCVCVCETESWTLCVQ